IDAGPSHSATAGGTGRDGTPGQGRPHFFSRTYPPQPAAFQPGSGSAGIGQINRQTCQFYLARFPADSYLAGMNDVAEAPNPTETAAADLSVAIRQLLRRLRMEADPGELS